MRTLNFSILRSFDDFTSEETVGNPHFEVPPTVKLEKRCRTCRRFRRGAAVVEFAVVAPVFFLLVIGMIEFGRAIMVQQIMTNASREGARVGVLDSATPTASLVKQTVVDYCTNSGISAVTASCVSIDAGAAHSGEPTAAGYGESVKVTVRVPYMDVTWIPAPWFLKDKTLQASTVMRRETVQ